jgi:uncharacterized protein (TIRG00374 family)
LESGRKIVCANHPPSKYIKPGRRRVTESAAAQGFQAKPLAWAMIKFGIAAILIYLLTRTGRLDFSPFGEISIDSRTIGWVVFGAGCVFVGQALLALRLKLFLRPVAQVAFLRTFGLTLIGSFSGALLPGLLMGDAVKAVYLFGDTENEKARAVAIVASDRITGIFSLFLLGALTSAFILGTGIVAVDPILLIVAPMIVALVLIGVGFAWLLGERATSSMHRLWDRIPETIRTIAATAYSYLRRPKILAAAIALSVLNHALVVVSFVVAGLLLTDQLSPLHHLAVDPLAMVMNIVPFTPGGIGLTEGAFSFFHDAIGSNRGAEVALLGRGVQYLAFLVGGAVAFATVKMKKTNAGQKGESA